MVADKIVIYTKSMSGESPIEIVLFKTSSKESGNIYIKEVDSKEPVKCGTCVQFELEVDPVPSSVPWISDSSDIDYKYRRFDPVTDESLDDALGQILKKILEFSRLSPFPINLEVDGEIVPLEDDAAKADLVFDGNRNVALAIRPTIGHPKWRISFRGQSVQTPLFIQGFDGEVNLLGFSAADTLTLNRMELRSTKYSQINNTVVEGICDFIGRVYADGTSENSQLSSVTISK